MLARALRGVCVGVDRVLAPGDTADLPAAEVSFLMSIGAVELVVDQPKPIPEIVRPVKAGKEK